LPSQLRRVPVHARDRYDEPLFADLVEEAYLSRDYTFTDYKALSPLGTCQMTCHDMIRRIQADLGRADSKMKPITTDEDWHTRAAKLLSNHFANATRNVETIKSLNLIPLQDRRWVSARTRPIFLPTTGDNPIPTDLGLNLVQPVAALNDARRTLFSHLGVTTALSSSRISHISDRYDASSLCTMDENISHLRYLYWNLSQDILALDRNIFLIDQNGNRVYRHIESVYFEEEDEEYGPRQLLQSAPLENPDAPGFAVHFLNVAYLDAVPTGALHQGRSWKQWLMELAGVQSYPRLQNPNRRTLSDEFKYVIEHRPEKLVELLKRYWSFYEPEMTDDIVRVLKECWVPSDEHLAVDLKSTFLPLPRLKAMVERLEILDFPFLTMPEELTDEDENEWQFLKRFGVRSRGRSDDLYFYVEALSRIADENEDECNSDILRALFDVYGAIERNCSSSNDAAYV
jgi:hypothetical protein